jgi:hypothetical protein
MKGRVECEDAEGVVPARGDPRNELFAKFAFRQRLQVASIYERRAQGTGCDEEKNMVRRARSNSLPKRTRIVDITAHQAPWKSGSSH